MKDIIEKDGRKRYLRGNDLNLGDTDAQPLIIFSD
jgi:hypothetical protein